MQRLLAHEASRIALRPSVLLLAGFAAMYLPVYWQASQDLWQREDFSHGPILLVVAAWLFWQARGAIAAAPDRPVPALGWPLLALGLLVYEFGRILQLDNFEFLSQAVVVASMLVLFKGLAGLRAAWFPVCYLLFLVPLPGFLVDALTAPLRHWIAQVVVESLHALGYPIGRAGVMITIGSYQLLVAEACSGLNSMFSLSALGTLFVYVMGRRSVVHNALMVAAIVPIALLANIVRVLILVLVTYHLGDEAGQGFLHGAAGIVMMLAALTAFFALDAILHARTGRPAR